MDVHQSETEWLVHETDLRIVYPLLDLTDAIARNVKKGSERDRMIEVVWEIIRDTQQTPFRAKEFREAKERSKVP